MKLARSFNCTLRYIDDALLLTNCKLGDFADHIYTIELEIKDTIDTARSASCLDLHHRDLVKRYGVSVSHHRDLVKRYGAHLCHITVTWLNVTEYLCHK